MRREIDCCETCIIDEFRLLSNLLMQIHYLRESKKTELNLEVFTEGKTNN